MGWQEKLKEYNIMQVIKKEEEKERALKNIIRNIEKEKLNSMWKYLCTECREETEKVYILERLIWDEERIEDKETGNIYYCTAPKGSYQTFETRQEAEDEENKIRVHGYTTKIYHLSIRDIEDMLRQIYRENKGNNMRTPFSTCYTCEHFERKKGAYKGICSIRLRARRKRFIVEDKYDAMIFVIGCRDYKGGV